MTKIAKKTRLKTDVNLFFSAPPASTNKLLLMTGDKVLLTTGDKILLVT
jgi:hypothetical protein